MKKVICFLFIVQLFIISSYGLLLLRGHYLNLLTNGNTTTFTIYFNDYDEYDYEKYYYFLKIIEKYELTVSKISYKDSNTIQIFTSDISLGSKIRIKSGDFPSDNTDEFVSNVDTGEITQSGVIYNVVPGFDISISNIESIVNTGIDGFYNINTTEISLIESLLDELKDNVNYIELWSINESFFNNFEGISIIQIVEFFIISFLLLICVIISLIQYSIEKLKPYSILSLHGISNRSIISITVIEILKLLLISSAIAYVLSVLYGIYMGYTSFIYIITGYFVLICGTLMLIYSVFINVFIQLYLYFANTVNIIKGKKPYVTIQVINHLSKITFSIFLLLSIYIFTTNFVELKNRMYDADNWYTAQNLYTVQISYVGQRSLNIERIITEKLEEFYEYMVNNYKGFIMNSNNIFYSDEKSPYVYEPAYPLEISPNASTVHISSNYLNINPIVAINDIPIQEQLIEDPNVLNILVPYKFIKYHNDIIEIYLEEFYHRKVAIENIYNSAFGIDLNYMEVESLQLNIIYVEDNQYYFSFDPNVRINTGNTIKDPIAVVYTGSIDKSSLYSNFTHSFYFYTDASNPYYEILPILRSYELESVIQRVLPVFNEYGEVLIQLREQYLKTIVLGIILLVANLAVTYNLMTNYFERNKFKLFLKKLFGFNTFQRIIGFSTVIIVYTTIIFIAISVFLSVWIFIAGIILLLIDILAMLFFENRLLNKSFSEIMKGEH